MAINLPPNLQAIVDGIPQFHTEEFYLVCEKCGTGNYPKSREEMELPCLWCGNPSLTIFQRIVKGGQ